jgi:hypothetical protein
MAPASGVQASEPTVHIEILGGRDRGPVHLHARYVDLERTRWMERAKIEETPPVCTAPCDIEVADTTEASFFVAGPRVARSNVFTLPMSGPVTLEVRPRPRGVRELGLVLAPLGALGVIAGAVTMVIADNDPRLLTAGGITLGASIPFVVVGAVLARWGRSRARVRLPSGG